MSITVRSAHLDPNCEGCMAAKEALEGYKSLVAIAQKRIRGLYAETVKLRAEAEAAKEEGFVSK